LKYSIALPVFTAENPAQNGRGSLLKVIYLCCGVVAFYSITNVPVVEYTSITTSSFILTKMGEAVSVPLYS